MAAPTPQPRQGMVISLPGVLLRAADACARLPESEHLEWPLRQLLDHLRELRVRPEVHAEFFALWTDEDASEPRKD